MNINMIKGDYEMTPLKNWANKNHLGMTTVYRMLKRGQLQAVKVGKLTFITDEADKAFKESLPEYKPQSAGQ